MKIKYPLACAALLVSLLSCPIAAKDTTPIAEEIHNRVAYGTPTIDGYLDSEYLQSEKIDYKYIPVYLGKYADSKEEIKKHYEWDTGIEAYSYLLWDNENIYVYISVKDSSSGIVDFDKAESDPEDPETFTYQDGIFFSLFFNDVIYPTFAERGGRFFGLTNNMYDDSISGLAKLKGFPYNREEITGLNNDCFAIVNSNNEYTAEFKIPLTAKGSEYLKIGSRMRQMTSVRNYIDTLNYQVNSMSMKTEPGFSDGVWYAEVTYGTEFDIKTLSVIARYMGLVGSSKGDVNGDSYTDSRDLVRLMKNIAENIVTEPTSDVNLDGEVDVRDLVALMKKISLG